MTSRLGTGKRPTLFYSAAVAKSYTRKGFLIYDEMRKYLVVYTAWVSLAIFDFATAPFGISLYMEKILFLFYQCSSDKEKRN